MVNDNKINVIRYGSRTFSEFREDLISLIKETYPEVLNDFTDSNVGSMLIDLNAGVGNNLSITIDRVFQETQLEYAQQRASLLNIAKNMGFNIPNKRPSITVVDLSVIVPVLGDSPDASYYPVMNAGAQIVGGGKTFETLDVVDWGSPISSLGDANRSIIPNYNTNGIIISYTITKREIVVNGTTSIYRKVINDNNITPFYSVTLPDNDVIEINNVILMEGTNFTTTPSDSDFNNKNIQFFEVDYLAQQRVFLENVDSSYVNTDVSSVKIGKWFDVTKKFIKEFTPQGFCKLTFGSGDPDYDLFRNGFIKQGITNRNFLYNILNNKSLGEKLKSNHTLFVKYRTGGGSNSNLGSGVLNQMGNYVLRCNGSRQDYVQNVLRSIKVNNPIPAIGGNDGMSNEQIRHLVKYNFSSQNRDVVLSDYLSQLNKMPGKFGSPFRANVAEVNNKIVISILNVGSNGKLSNTSNNLLKENIAEYLSQYRMINDFIEIKDGKIFNLAFDIDVYVENISDNQVANSIINVVRDYMDINNHEMNQDLFIGQLQNKILEVVGVINVIEIKVYNKFGNGYSNNVISQAISDTKTGLISQINNTIYSTDDSMFEILYPEKDIKVYLRKKIF